MRELNLMGAGHPQRRPELRLASPAASSSPVRAVAGGRRDGMTAAGVTRRKMVSCASLLGRHGVHGTSFARVIDDSGTPAGSIPHRFPGGDHELIRSAITEAGTEAAVVLRHLTDSVKGLERADFRAGCPLAAAANDAFDDPGLRQAAQAAIEGSLLLAGAQRRCEPIEAVRAQPTNQFAHEPR